MKRFFAAGTAAGVAGLLDSGHALTAGLEALLMDEPPVPWIPSPPGKSKNLPCN